MDDRSEFLDQLQEKSRRLERFKRGSSKYYSGSYFLDTDPMPMDLNGKTISP